MRKSLSVLAAIALAAVAGAASAHNCPNEIKAIDARLSSSPAVSKENQDKVGKLRAQAEADHKAGKHSEAMKAAAEAKKILGI